MLVNVGFRQTDAGLLPEDWSTATIHSVCKPNGLVRGPFGGSLKKEEFVKAGYKVYEQKNAINHDADIGNYFINSKKFRELKRFEIKENDFIVSCSGTIGKIFQIPSHAKPGIINQALLKIMTNDKVIFNKFFLYIFESDSFQNKVIESQGGAMKNLVGMDIIKKICIPFPKYNEQRAIATALSDADANIFSLNEIIAKKRDIKQAAMQELLTGKHRLPGFASNKWYIQTEIGMIPADWEICTVSQFGDVKRGAGSQYIKYVRNNGVRLIRINDFFEHNPVFISPTDEIMKYAINENDVLFAGTGSSAGASYIPKEDWIGLPHSYNVPRIRVKKNQSKQYLLFSLQSDYVANQQRAWFVGAAQPFLDTHAISNFKIALPKLVNEQRAIATVLSDMDTEIAALEHQRDKTKAIKQGMMQELLTGRIRLV